MTYRTITFSKEEKSHDLRHATRCVARLLHAKNCMPASPEKETKRENNFYEKKEKKKNLSLINTTRSMKLNIPTSGKSNEMFSYWYESLNFRSIV